MLLVKSPNTRLPEREYIFRIIFQYFLGIEYDVLYEDRTDFEIGWPGASCKLLLPDVFLQTPEKDWLHTSSLPAMPLERIEHSRYGSVPILFGKSKIADTPEDGVHDRIYCQLDIFGSAFFMLTRYEEYVLPERDARDRFPAESSIAFRENFLQRPIVNEYLEILWESILVLRPGITRKRRKAAIMVSHDVDWPFYSFNKNRYAMLKEALGDAVKRHNMQSAWSKAKAVWSTRQGDLRQDPFNTFRWLMELSERAGIRSAFYFITEQTDSRLDGNYSVYDRDIQALLREIHARGHEIGLHPSYETYERPDRIRRQFEILRDVAERNGIYQEEWGGRQHYLRWKAPDTWQHWEDAGLHYDSTLGYPDLPGFRCGTCYEYPVYNLQTRKQLRLVERPLIMMEQTVLPHKLRDFHLNEVINTIGGFYEQCKIFGGSFTLLWHNSMFTTKEQQSIYLKCLDQ